MVTTQNYKWSNDGIQVGPLLTWIDDMDKDHGFDPVHLDYIL